MRRPTRGAVENPRGDTARVHQRLLEVRRLMERNEVVIRALQDQDVLPDTLRGIPQRVRSECLQRVFEANSCPMVQSAFL
jgi:hypothetical protein